MRRWLSLLAIYFLLTSFSFAEIISSFNYSGLKKTKTSYLDKVLSHFIGQENNEETIHDIETVLQAEGIFEKITVLPSEENKEVIEITLKEKITFIPLPFLTVSNGKWMGGGIVMNMNAFGNKTMLMGGGFLSSSTDMGVFGLSKPAANVDDLGWSIFTAISNNTQDYTDIYDEEYASFEHLSINFNFAIQKKITPVTSLGGGFGYNFRKMNDNNSFNDGKDVSSQAKITTTLAHGITDWNGWYLNSKMANVALNAGYDFNLDNLFYYATSSIVFQHPLTNRLRFCTTVSASYENNTYILQWPDQSAGSVSILPPEFRTPEIAGGNTGFELAIKKFGFGLFSIYTNYQGVYAKNVNDEYKFCHGVSGGMRLYLSKIAFPAFAFGMSRNITTKDLYWSGSIGVSF